MSAFMCSAKHLTLLASYALRFGVYGAGGIVHNDSRPEAEILRSLFKLLARENARSLDARYPGDKPDDSAELMEPVPGALTAWMDAAPIAIVKACHCYAYQACEHRGWETSLARKLVDHIEGHAIRRVPGYEQAPWGI